MLGSVIFFLIVVLQAIQMAICKIPSAYGTKILNFEKEKYVQDDSFLRILFTLSLKKTKKKSYPLIFVI